jgi:hypothetical protein
MDGMYGKPVGGDAAKDRKSKRPFGRDSVQRQEYGRGGEEAMNVRVVKRWDTACRAGHGRPARVITVHWRERGVGLGKGVKSWNGRTAAFKRLIALRRLQRVEPRLPYGKPNSVTALASAAQPGTPPPPGSPAQPESASPTHSAAPSRWARLLARIYGRDRGTGRVAGG